MLYRDLQAVAQKRLDAFIEIGLGDSLWKVQKQISLALSKPRARVVVPSCNGSGKTYLAARLALAFFYAFPDAKIVTTSSTESQLKDALWAEIRTAYANSLVPIPGRLPPADMWLREGDMHFLKGTVARGREGFQGIHSGHKLIIADEASSVDEEAASGINALLSSGDARLLVILNPTGSDSWAANQAFSPNTTTIKIDAFATPNLAHLTNEEIRNRWGQEMPEDRVPESIPSPENANLVTPHWLDEMVREGQGPGTVEWTNRIMGEFWSSEDSQLIVPAWTRMAKQVDHHPGVKVMGIDLAPHGTDENVIAYRIGNSLLRLEPYPAIRPDLFWQHVRTRVLAFRPHMLVWDADGVGAGSYTDAELAIAGTEVVLRPFRGGLGAGEFYNNTRTRSWWLLRRAIESGAIRIAIEDKVFEDQLHSLTYDFADNGKIKVDSKAKMKRQGKKSPDRADAFMYAFAENPPKPPPKGKISPQSDTAAWLRDLKQLDDPPDEEPGEWSLILGGYDW